MAFLILLEYQNNKWVSCSFLVRIQMYVPLLCAISKGWVGNIVLFSDYVLKCFMPHSSKWRIWHFLCFSLDSWSFSEVYIYIYMCVCIIIVFKEYTLHFQHLSSCGSLRTSQMKNLVLGGVPDHGEGGRVWNKMIFKVPSDPNYCINP